MTTIDDRAIAWSEQHRDIYMCNADVIAGLSYKQGAIEQKQIDDDARTMQLSDYTTEELKVELKRRADVIKAEHEKVKRCRHCKHLLCKNHRGEEVERDSNNIFGCQCKVTTSKVKPHKLKWVNKSQKACDKFEEI